MCRASLVSELELCNQQTWKMQPISRSQLDEIEAIIARKTIEYGGKHQS